MLSFEDVIPVRHSIRRGEALNILAIANNPDEDVRREISVWGRTDGEWKKLVSREYDIASHEHKHMYFTIDGYLFAGEFWGEDPEEVEICVSDRVPDRERNGVLIIVLQDRPETDTPS